MTHTIQVRCTRCGGDGHVILESPAIAMACPVCDGMGLETIDAAAHLRGYLGGAKSFRELVIRLDRALVVADARALNGIDREAQNLAAVEAEVLGAARQALHGLLAPIWARGAALRAKKGRTPTARGVQTFVPRKG